jgi:hypothetical protein
VGVRELLIEFLAAVDEPVKSILVDVIVAEQRKIDMERPRMKADVQEIIDAYVRKEERGR